VRVTTAEALQELTGAIYGLTDAVKLFTVQIIELRRENRETKADIREIRDRLVVSGNLGEWAKTHPWPMALIILALLLALSGQLSLLPSVIGASIHAAPSPN